MLALRQSIGVFALALWCASLSPAASILLDTKRFLLAFRSCRSWHKDCVSCWGRRRESLAGRLCVLNHLPTQHPDFSVVLFRLHFMLVSEEHPMKTHKNQWLLNLLSLPDIRCGATNQVTHYGIWGADAFAVT
jgi:hypothetical protein